MPTFGFQKRFGLVFVTSVALGTTAVKQTLCAAWVAGLPDKLGQNFVPRGGEANENQVHWQPCRLLTF